MCIIIDPPLFVPMFKTTDPNHGVYQPVRDWVDSGSGKFVVGGTQYAAEVQKVCSVLMHLVEYERRGKIIRRDRTLVDAEVALVKQIEPSTDFDDPHLVALVRECGCKLICVNDPRSHRYLRATMFYKSPKDRPKLYTRVKNANLLCQTNIPTCFR